MNRIMLLIQGLNPEFEDRDQGSVISALDVAAHGPRSRHLGLVSEPEI